ncbi:hypothetical protein GCM10023165_47830 [Variovorax defluvii]|uniref:Uncharacterized protein n=1 Tax=Variovorax defluvii TaxID=913761 RepID=A0ABP8IC00_9BURK
MIVPASAPGPMVFDAAALVGKSLGQASSATQETAAIKAAKTEAKSTKRKAAVKAQPVKRKG